MTDLVNEFNRKIFAYRMTKPQPQLESDPLNYEKEMADLENEIESIFGMVAKKSKGKTLGKQTAGKSLFRQKSPGQTTT